MGSPEAVPREAAPAAGDDAKKAAIEMIGKRLGYLDQQLAEAHGFYQRDCTDLARQRDVALAQRDQRQQALDHLQSSLAWRIARRPQKALDAMSAGLQRLAFRLRQLRSLAGRGITSLRVRGWAGTLERWRQRRAAPSGDTRLVRPPSPSASGAALRLPQPRTPRASIIVPVYNQLHMTLGCLRALADSGDATAFEVIVVDDGLATGASMRAAIQALRAQARLSAAQRAQRQHCAGGIGLARPVGRAPANSGKVMVDPEIAEGIAPAAACRGATPGCARGGRAAGLVPALRRGRGLSPGQGRGVLAGAPCHS